MVISGDHLETTVDAVPYTEPTAIETGRIRAALPVDTVGGPMVIVRVLIVWTSVP